MIPYQETLKAYLTYAEQHPFRGQPAELYDPTNYILQLGGKRVRPLLALLGHQLVKPIEQDAFKLAHAVEVFHNFTLMHDDIMDRADIRRGQPTVHVKWNQNIAILSGDLMLVKAYQLLNEIQTEAHQKDKIIGAFGKMAEAVCVGQQFDMNFETQTDVSEAAYLHMIEGKTSVLLAYSLMAGGMLAGIDERLEQDLYDYGLYIGLAFQVMDDYLDTFGNADNFGKRIGGDILENKKTLLWIEANKRCSPEQQKQLDHWYSQSVDSEAKIQEVTALFKSLGVDQYAKEKMQLYLNQASSHLQKLNAQYDTSSLEALANDLNVRSQ